MQTDELNRELAIEYFDQLKYHDTPHEKIFITFSGVPASGKTTLARKLARDIQAQYIRQDDIRTIVEKHGLDASKLVISQISVVIIGIIIARDANKCIIIDASIDRSWPTFFEGVKKHNAKPIVIRFNTPREIVEARMTMRDDHDFGKVTDRLDVFYEQFERCKLYVRADIDVGEVYNYADVCRRIKMLL